MVFVVRKPTSADAIRAAVAANLDPDIVDQLTERAIGKTTNRETAVFMQLAHIVATLKNRGLKMATEASERFELPVFGNEMDRFFEQQHDEVRAYLRHAQDG